MSRRQEARAGATSTQHHVPSAPSQTTTETPSQPQPQQQTSRILRLRGARNTNGRSVQWAEDVVDNEGLGRKSSKGSSDHMRRSPLPTGRRKLTAKVCCIYHRPKAVDESSDESSSDSDVSSGDEDADRKGKDHKCGGPGHSHDEGKKGNGSSKRAPSPNAYEKVPKVKPKEEGANKG